MSDERIMIVTDEYYALMVKKRREPNNSGTDTLVNAYRLD